MTLIGRLKLLCVLMRKDFYSSYFTGYGTDYTVFAGYFSGDDYTDEFYQSE